MTESTQWPYNIFNEGLENMKKKFSKLTFMTIYYLSWIADLKFKFGFWIELVMF